jgi:hypothetical protein
MHGRQTLGEFISATEVKREQLEWGSLAWFSSPETSNSKELVLVEVSFSPRGAECVNKNETSGNEV